jgi:hypothetical protein
MGDPADTTPLTRHPAKFSEAVLDALHPLVRAEARRRGEPVTVLDPFAGVGRVHQLATRNGAVTTVGLEIQARWAACHQRTIHTDAMQWMAMNEHPFDLIVTSPTYGNRLADHHDARDGSRRRSYTHDYGQALEDNNSGTLHWGPDYWRFHALAYSLMLRNLTPGGLLLLDVSDFHARKALVSATEWHRGAAMGVGFVHGGRDVPVVTPRLRGVGNAATAARAPHETILRLRRSPLPKEEV